MPGKKRKTKQRKPSGDSSHDVGGESVADVNHLHIPRESQFSGFLDGLQATSSPSSGVVNKEDERKQTAIRMAEEQLRVVEEAIDLRFDPTIADLETTEIGRTAVWREGDYRDVVQSVLDAIKAEEVHSKSHGSYASGTRKVTFAETPRTELRPTMSTRRSKSADPVSHLVSRTQRLSAGHSYPELKDAFHYNIATVLPHPHGEESMPKASILRKPKIGETAISMAGSPLLVHSDHVSVASLNLPLADGRVFNVQGDSTPFRKRLRIGLDDETINQLKGIKDFISNLVP